MRVCNLLRAFTGLAVLLSLAMPATAHARIVTIDINQARGVDASVDYARLVQYGPWDDRNYALTAADLAYLPKEETEARDPLPAFYRVWARKAAIAEGHPLPTSGAAQYPRKAVNVFLSKFGGLQIDGKVYRAITRLDDGKFEVYDEEELEEMSATWPRFVSGEVKITPPGYEETAIAVNPVNTDIVIAGSNGTGSNQVMWRSTNGGANWTGPINLPSNSFCDPSVGWSTDGQMAYTTSLLDSGTAGGAIYRSTDAGVTWTQGASFGNGSNSDKEYLHVDSATTSPYKDNLYVSWHENNVQKFVRSTDKGATFGPTLTIDSGFVGIGSDIASDKDGNVYYFFPTSSGARQVRVAKSTNGGTSFAAGVKVADTKAQFDFPLPSMPSRRAFIYVSADADLSNGPYANSIYVAWPDTYDTENESSATANHARVQVAYSRDGGATWTTTTPHPTTDQSTVDRYQEWLKVDQWGRVHVMYYDTRNSANRTGVDVYYSVSLDGAQTWQPPRRLTTVTSPKINTSMEWGDYNGMDMAMNDIIAIYTDNRLSNGGEVWAVGGFADSPAPDYSIGLPNTTQYVCAGNAINPISASVSSLGGYAGTVTLSLPGLDTSAFTGGLFAPNPVTPPTNGSTTSMLTLGTQPGAAAGSYTVTVHGTDNQVPAVANDATFDVQIASGQPGVPSPTLPADGSTGTPRQPVFSWSADPAAVGYTIEIATDAGFTAIVDTGTPSAATYTPATALQPQTTYYWRVRSNSPCGNSSTSQVFSFTTGVTFPEPYCSVSFPSNVEPITHVLVAAIDKTSSPVVNGTPALEDFTATVGNVAAGSNASIKVEGNTDGNYTTYIAAYVDWNHNGTFDAGEGTNVGSITNSTGTDGKQAIGTIAVPAGALAGATRMRVIKKYATSAVYPGACNTDGYGQAEDYTITVGGTPSYTVGGSVGGLTGSGLVLSLNAGAQTLPVAANGAFTFPTGLANGAAYAVTIGTQPSGQTCSVANGSGTISGANVTNVAVTCAATPTYTIGGTVSGLSGAGLVLSLNAGSQTLPVSTNGAFTFPTAVANGTAYTVTVGTQPAGQTCTVANGSGTVAGANVTNVAVGCIDDVSDSIFVDGFDLP